MEKYKDREVKTKGTKQVRTVARVMKTAQEDSEKFDDEVNEAIRDGWRLSRRYATSTATQVLLIAELTRYV